MSSCLDTPLLRPTRRSRHDITAFPRFVHPTSTRLALALHVWYHCYPPFSLTAYALVVSVPH